LISTSRCPGGGYAAPSPEQESANSRKFLLRTKHDKLSNYSRNDFQIGNPIIDQMETCCRSLACKLQIPHMMLYPRDFWTGM